MRYLTLKIASLLMILLLSMTLSCTKDEIDEMPENTLFENITRDKIASNTTRLSGKKIEATNSNGQILNIGDILIYKTNDNHYGKLKILDYDYDNNIKLTIESVAYNDDGSIFKHSKHLEIRGTFLCDLDLMIETGLENSEFHWERINKTDTNLSPKDDAVFAIY